jgi:thymidylate synthase
MIVVEAESADSAWRELFEHFRTSSRVQESRDQQTRELLHVATTIRDPRQRLVFSRPVNPAFAVAEVIWILAGFDSVSFLAFWNPRLRRFSDDGLRMHGAYGPRLGSNPKLEGEAEEKLRPAAAARPFRDQLKMAAEALAHTRHSRQVVLQIWDASRDMPNPAPRSKDVPCNLISHLMVREDRLHWLQVMRSNDFIWGFPYNMVQFSTIQEIIAGWLGLNVGPYVHISDSLHVYKRHWDALDKQLPQGLQIPANRADLRVGSYREWEEEFRKVVTSARRLTELHSPKELLSIVRNTSLTNNSYQEWIALLTAEALRRRGHMSKALEAVELAGPFWKTSWKQWAEAASLAQPRTDDRGLGSHQETETSVEATS